MLLLATLALSIPLHAQRPAAWLDPDRTAPPGFTYRTFQSRLAKSEVSYLLYLPPGYESSTRRYPVVYWLHGMGGSQRSGTKVVQTMGNLMQAGKAPHMLVVLVNGMRDSFYVDAADGSTPVESVIVKELVPHIDKTLRTFPEREARMIEGFSMGGFGSARIGFSHPEVFGAVNAMAGAFEGVENIATRRPELFERVFRSDLGRVRAATPAAALQRNLTAIRGKQLIRVAVGADDPGLERNRAAHEMLDRLNIPHDFEIVPGVAHSHAKLYETLADRACDFHRKAFARHSQR